MSNHTSFSVIQQKHYRVIRWILRIVILLYIVCFFPAINILPDVEKVNGAVVFSCYVVVWFIVDVVFRFRDRYQLVWPFKRVNVPSALDYLETYAFSEARHNLWLRSANLYSRGHYVYIIKDASASGYYKVGRSIDVQHRIRRFEVIMPFQLHVMFVLTCNDEVALERFLHLHFASKRMDGEWFKLSGEDLAWIMLTYGIE